MVCMTMIVYITAIFLPFPAYATAADASQENKWSKYTTDELQVMLKEISEEIGRRIMKKNNSTAEKSADSGDKSLGRIIDIFPDEVLAKTVRDSCGKISIEQNVTQNDLDKITYISIAGSNNDIYDLTGIGYLRNVESIALISCYKNTTLPDELYFLPKLEAINIMSGNLTALSPLLGNLISLTYLGISGCNITTIPETIGTLHNLKSISLLGNNITSLPDTIGNLVNLDTLSVCENHLSALPDSICNLYNLKTLVIFRNEISVLPDNIGNLINLKEFFASNNKFSYLPESIGNLINLQSLDISGTNVEYLPETIGKLKNLKHLYISYTKIKTLPDSIVDLDLDVIDMKGLPIK